MRTKKMIRKIVAVVEKYNDSFKTDQNDWFFEAMLRAAHRVEMLHMPKLDYDFMETHPVMIGSAFMTEVCPGGIIIDDNDGESDNIVLLPWEILNKKTIRAVYDFVKGAVFGKI